MKKVFQGRPVVPGAVQAPAVVSHGGFNTLASFQKSLLAKAKEAVCGDQNNADLYNKPPQPGLPLSRRKFSKLLARRRPCVPLLLPY